MKYDGTEYRNISSDSFRVKNSVKSNINNCRFSMIILDLQQDWRKILRGIFIQSSFEK